MSEKKSSEQTVQELQMNEHQHQQMMLEKQNLQIELNEITNALNEIKVNSSEVYRVMGNVMLKANPSELIKELEEEKKIIDMKISSIEKQEEVTEKKIQNLRNELNNIVSKER